MNREEAIEILKAHHMWTGEPQEIIDVRKENKALEMAISALEQKPCEDAVSRKDAIKALQNVVCISAAIKSRMVGAIEGLPSVTQKSGKWIEDSPHYICSECNYVHHLQRFEVMSGCKLGNFCPNCGAKMESEE